ncbi:glycine/D-amino acid oxidase-like deaminating enzyme [Rhodovulum imhoffii]|uniref:Glycine/D-amino acid oxidase-like deaminating enzyme n=1 Tax=Rhodovulum imhoffii TaxID=365340 RepID=A0A2T5BST1_9RHOB|nr:FAD-dependent oxidoreductase [Rhodovulum imhoffii]MBK5933725.1 FAD-dependent oxidoreductase [Rhodovulum imhoffii]PTN02442.1 glycine/D-amino acid oxidase-like deaminating enzyme [Rhodovulum imhoffii]
MSTEYAIVGGGVVGLSLAWGLLKRGCRVLVLDGGDGGLRASRGNFGLVWVQGKGLDQPAYARWSQRSAKAWGDFAAELGEATGTDLCLHQQGGYDFHFSEETLEARVAQYRALRPHLAQYPFEVLGPNALKAEEPHIGPGVAGAILHHQDGHVNPLRLLQALAADVRRLGGKVLTGKHVSDIAPGDGFTLTCADGTVFRAAKVVLAAGLGARDLGPKLGFVAPVRPQRGQVLVTEKLPRLLNRPSGIIRQVNEGGIQIGDSKEEVGLDDSVTLKGIAAIAVRAVRVCPALARAQIVRSWGALRILTPDGLPIYQQSPQAHGAFLVTCHSGITLAAAHARFLPDWLEGADIPNLETFSEKRFSISRD